ncbi:MAG: hypothetical protein ACRCXT_22120 [Paraclostridium sp.]
MKTEFKMKTCDEFPGIEVNLIGCRCRRKVLLDLIICTNNLLSIQGKEGIDVKSIIKDGSVYKEDLLVNILKGLDINIYNAYIKCMLGEPGYYFNKDKGYYNITTQFTDSIEKDKYSSVWYIDNPVCIANIKDSDGTSIYVESVGEVKYILTVLDSGDELELCRTKDFNYYFKNDSEVISALNNDHPEYALDILSNNWFEISIKDKYDNYINDSVSSDSDDIRTAILDGYKLFMTQM